MFIIKIAKYTKWVKKPYIQVYFVEKNILIAYEN